MKKIFLVVMFPIICLPHRALLLKGNMFNAATKKSIPSVNVFITK